VVLVLAILKEAKRGEENGRKTRVQKKQWRDSMNQRNRDATIEEHRQRKMQKNLKCRNLKQTKSSYDMSSAAES